MPKRNRAVKRNSIINGKPKVTFRMIRGEKRKCKVFKDKKGKVHLRILDKRRS